MLTRLLVYFAYSLKASARYGQTRQFFCNLPEKSHSRLKTYFDAFMQAWVVPRVFCCCFMRQRAPDGKIVLFEQTIAALARTELTPN